MVNATSDSVPGSVVTSGNSQADAVDPNGPWGIGRALAAAGGIPGITVTGTPASGQVLTATSTSAATWKPATQSAAGVSPAGLGLALLTLRPAEVSDASAAVAAGTLLLVMATAVKTQTVSILGTWLTTAGATPGSGINGMAIYSEAGALLNSTASMTSQFTGSAGFVEGTLAASVSVTAGVNYYLALLTNLTSGPQFGALPTDSLAIPGLNGHYHLASATSVTSFAGVTPSGMSNNGITTLMYAR